MKRKSLILSFAFLSALLLALAAPLAALADEGSITFKAGADGTNIVVFEPGSVFTDTDLFDNFKGVMPGDRREERITIHNKFDDCDYVKVWMKAVPHTDVQGENPISPAVLALLTADERRGETPELDYMLDFLAQLSLEVKSGGETVYKASPDELDGLAESVYLGKITADETITLNAVLVVPAELGNGYANRIGEVDWVFTVESFDIPTPPPEDTTLTVRKIWEDDGKNRPTAVTVELLDGETPYAKVELNEENQWTYTWDKLDKKREWNVREVGVPDGYTAAYAREGSVVTVTNTRPATPPPTVPVDLTVRKVWDNKGGSKPESVKITLYDGNSAVESVWLGEWNGWTHKWRGLDGSGHWQVIETAIPRGYVPSYACSGGVVTITNTGTLIQTGQLKWPIPVLAALGLLLIVCGIIVYIKKRKHKDA